MKRYTGNQDIAPVKSTKPHIVFIDRYWRVSSMPKPYHRYQGIWRRAHTFAGKLNDSLHSRSNV